MARSAKVVIRNRRVLHTYSQLWRASGAMLRRAQNEDTGRYWLWMASLVFAAFTLEAYLNHIGSKIFASWRAMESLSLLSKLEVIAEKLGIAFPHDKRPWQTARDLVRFRNEMAHGRTIANEAIVRLPDMLTPEGEAEGSFDFASTSSYPAAYDGPSHWWEEYCTESNAQRVHADVRALLTAIHDRAKIAGDVLFDSGPGERSVSIERDG